MYFKLFQHHVTCSTSEYVYNYYIYTYIYIILIHYIIKCENKHNIDFKCENRKSGMLNLRNFNSYNVSRTNNSLGKLAFT